MAEESTYPVVTSLLSSHRIRLILNALGGPTGTGSISAADFLSSQIVQDMIDTWTDNHILAGTGVTLDRTTDPHMRPTTPLMTCALWFVSRSPQQILAQIQRSLLGTTRFPVLLSSGFCR
jgi:hypothetical protein